MLPLTMPDMIKAFMSSVQNMLMYYARHSWIGRDMVVVNSDVCSISVTSLELNKLKYVVLVEISGTTVQEGNYRGEVMNPLG